jgi:tRNA (guanine37-N1)-methyltransferase
MQFNILTLFPEMFPGTLGSALAGKAFANGIWSYDLINIRDFAIDKYGTVDDAAYGGGSGLVMRPDVIAAALDKLGVRSEELGANQPIIYFSPRGKLLNQKIVREFVNNSSLHTPHSTLTLICGRYEGIDQRVIDEYGMIEISIGDYVLSGGELPAQVFIDSCVRLLDNVVGHSAETTSAESFEIGGLEWPLYTRPSAWRGHEVPEVLLSGHHENIQRWRKEQSDAITKERRPDLIDS